MANSITKLSDNFFGICYSCAHHGLPQDYDGAFTAAAYDQDFCKIRSKGFQVVRSYEIPGSLGLDNQQLTSLDHWFALVYAAYQNNLRVLLEIPVDPNNTANGFDNQTPWNDYWIDIVFPKFLSALGSTTEPPLDKYPVTSAMFQTTVIGILAGNENIAQDSNSTANVDLRARLVQALVHAGFGSIPVTYCLRCDVMAGDPQQYPNRQFIADSLPVDTPLFITCYPFEWGVNCNQAVTGNAPHSLQYYYQQIKTHFPHLKLALGETGWASYNPLPGTSYTLPEHYSAATNQPHVGPAGTVDATLANEVQYFNAVFRDYKNIGYTSVLAFEAFDEPQKSHGPNQTFQCYYGLWAGGPDSSDANWNEFKGVVP